MTKDIILASNSVVSAWSDPDQAAQLMDLAMHVFQVALDDRARPDVQSSVMQAMNRCMKYGLLPAQDVWLIPFTKSVKSGSGWDKITTYAVDTGVSAWQKFADRLAPRDWHAEYQTMPDAEARRLLGDAYIDGCLGVLCRIWILSKAYVLRDLGLEPEWYPGYYLVEEKDECKNGSRTGRKLIQPENLPSYRTAEDVARRRALKHALSRNFSPVFVGDLGDDPAVGLRVALEDAQPDRPLDARDTAFLERPVLVVEDNDGMIWDATTPVQTAPAARNGPSTPSPQAPAPTQDVDFSDASPDGPFADAPTNKAAIDAFVDRCRASHANSDAPASAKMYGYLAGLIDKASGNPAGHGVVLTELVGRHVDGTNPPGADMASMLLDQLAETRRNRETKEIEQNPNYSPAVVGFVQAVYEAMTAAA